MPDSRYKVDVSVVTRFLSEQSQPEQNRFAFAYTITVHNNGELLPGCCRGTGSLPTVMAMSRKYVAKAWLASSH